MDDDLFTGVPRLELAPSSEGMLVGALGGAGPCGLEIAPDAALSAGMWLLDVALGRVRDPLEVAEIVGPSTLRLARFAGGDGANCTVTLDVGEDPAQVVLDRVQAMLAGEHLIAYAVRSGARPCAQLALDPLSKMPLQ